MEYKLPLFPLGTVLFPSTTLPLRIFEPRYVDLVGRCMRDNSGFGVVAIKSGKETGQAAEPHATGTIARITDFDRGADGFLHVVIRGDERFKVQTHFTEDNNLLVAMVSELPPLPQRSVPSEFLELSVLLRQIEKGIDANLKPHGEPAGAAELAYRIAQYLPLSLHLKVELLELDDPLTLLSRLDGEVRRLQKSSEPR